MIITLILISIICTLGINKLNAHASEIDHTHIYTTTYNSNKHWEYCTVCGVKRNELEHEYVDDWYLGYASCSGSNYSIRTCDCGYSFKYKLPHTSSDTWKDTGSRGVHYKNCVNCGSWTSSGMCSDANGKRLGCNNPGACATCGFNMTPEMHYILGDGTCELCKLAVINVGEPEISYSSDYKIATVKFKITPILDNVELGTSWHAYTNTNNTTKITKSYEKHDDGSVTYTGDFYLDPNKQQKGTWNLGDNKSMVKINGYWCYLSTTRGKSWSVWYDHFKPSITNVTEVNQAYSNGWATIKQLTITGRDESSNIAYITLKDKLTGRVYLSKAAATAKVVGDHTEFTYVCTPNIEAPAEGRTYILICEDRLGNISDEFEFTIYKTDGTAPAASNITQIDWTTSIKNIAIRIDDYGSGNAQISFGNQTSYRDCDVYNADGSAIAYYVVDEMNSTKSINYYVRDGLGNAAKYTLKYGKVDTTPPTIEAVNKTGWSPNGKDIESVYVLIKANDYSEKLKGTGSGIEKYGYSLDGNNITWQTSNELYVPKDITKFVYVKDIAGHIVTIPIDTTVQTEKTIDLTGLVTGENILHNCVWVTEKDNTNHWTECIICRNKKDIEPHNLNTTWALGTESCRFDNTYTTNCSECSYSDTGHKPCHWDGKSYINVGTKGEHAKKCRVCAQGIRNVSYYDDITGKFYPNGEEAMHIKCTDSSGKILSCKVPGTCSKCKTAITKCQPLASNSVENRYIDASGKTIVEHQADIICKSCKTIYGSLVATNTIERLTDTTTKNTYVATVTLDKSKGLKFKTIAGSLSTDIKNIYSTNKTTATYNSDKTIGYITMNVVTNGSYNTPANSWNNVTYTDGTTDYPGYIHPCRPIPDVIAPVINDVEYHSVVEADGWTKSNSITVTGTENLSNSVVIDMIDKRGEVIFSKEVAVTNKNYSLTFSPDIEADADGEDFRIVVRDACKNESEDSITIYRVDGKAPTLLNAIEYIDPWSKEKYVRFEAYDDGSEFAEIGFNDTDDILMSNYIKSRDIYYRDYKFIGDVYGSVKCAVYTQDALGNATTTLVSIGKLDNTKPTIEGLGKEVNSSNRVVITVNSHDKNYEKLNGADGSGEIYFGYTMNPDAIIDDTGATLDSGWLVNRDIELSVNGTYYFYTMDLVGNISDRYMIEISDIVGLDAYIINKKTNDDYLFKNGEHGRLTIQHNGFVEVLEVILPEELVLSNSLFDANNKIHYTTPVIGTIEKADFIIPLEMEQTEYVIMVNTYKNGSIVSSKEVFLKVTGTVVEDIKTVIR